jgi:hypothetical protein
MSHAAIGTMITTILAVYIGLGVIFIAGVAVAAKRPVPQMGADKVCKLPHDGNHRSSNDDSVREAA